MFLAGLPIPDNLVLQLAEKLRDLGYFHVAERLETAYDRETKVLALELYERESILKVLLEDEGVPEFAELRGVLLADQVGRLRQGLARG